MSDQPANDKDDPISDLDAYRLERRAGFCSHRNVVIDETVRTVECDDCDAKLDAFDALVRIVMDHQRIKYQRKHMDQEIKRRAEKIESLKSEEKRQRDRVRRLKNTMTDAPPLRPVLPTSAK